MQEVQSYVPLPGLKIHIAFSERIPASVADEEILIDIRNGIRI